MFRNRNIHPQASLLEALKKMDEIDKKLLIVTDDTKFVGLLSAGDIQRAIIKNSPLTTSISEILRKSIRTGNEGQTPDEIKQVMQQYRMEFYPIVDSQKKVVDIYFWEDLFITEKAQKTQFQVPVVVMAGGYGTRLKPLTNVIPKPMIPIGETTMLEEIFTRFQIHGCTDFFVSVNYKADLIEYYIEQQNLPINIEFLRENEPLGTAGSLTLLKGKLSNTFFVNNCDIIIEDDYASILEYHKSEGNQITLVAALKSYHIPYGTVVSGKDGKLLELQEKPDLNFLINSGMYLLESELIDEIPVNTFYHITDLIKDVMNRGGKVGVFPVSEKSWIDMGDWNEYLQLIKKG